MAATTRWISSKREASVWLLLLVLALAAGLASCDGGPTGTQEEEDLGPDATVVFRGLTVSDVDDAAAGGSPLAAATPGVAYISASPGTSSDADSITVTNLANGQTRTVEPIDGGFDPVPLEAEPDDPIEFVVHRSDGSTRSYLTRVPARKRPRVVRTVPPKDATDVVLSSSVMAVFSEPMDARTVTAGTFQLQLNGQPVAGTLALTADGLRAEFSPAEPLHTGTTYLLVISTGVRDPEGDPLEAEVGIRFTTEGRVVFASVSVGGWHTCATGVNGSSYCWGWNGYGQLGNATTTENSRAVLVGGEHSFVSLPAALYHTCGLTASATAYCWGWNGDGELGNGTTTQSAMPVLVSGGHSFASMTYSCGLTADGTAYCWGPNGRGQLGAGTLVTHSTTPLPVSGGLMFTSLATGGAHTCALTADGAAYCWGNNYYGELGTVTSETCYPTETAPPCSRTPVPVTGELSFASLGAGGLHTCGLTADGYAYCWGTNGDGQLGTVTPPGQNQYTPVPVDGSRSYISISGGWSHTCALTASGEAFCWGDNEGAQLGNGGQGGRVRYPVRVVGSHRFEALTTNTGYHTCGLTADGDVYCWGWNEYGQLGLPPSATPEGSSAVPLLVEVP